MIQVPVALVVYYKALWTYLIIWKRGPSPVRAVGILPHILLFTSIPWLWWLSAWIYCLQYSLHVPTSSILTIWVGRKYNNFFGSNQISFEISWAYCKGYVQGTRQSPGFSILTESWDPSPSNLTNDPGCFFISDRRAFVNQLPWTNSTYCKAINNNKPCLYLNSPL